MKSYQLITTALLAFAASPLIAAGDPPVDFVKQIKPILAGRCVECHNSETLVGELNLQNLELAFRKRSAGPVIVPKEP